MQSSSLRRQMKNMVNNYTEAEIKVREATSNDPWGPSASLMADISDLTFNVVAFTEVMGIVFKRLNDHGKNWRHVYKALTLLDHLVKTGSERVPKLCRDNIHTIQTLKDFQYINRDGHDQGIHIREKAKRLVALLKDDAKLKSERSQAQKTKSRGGRSGAGYTGRHCEDDFSRCTGSPSFSSTPSPRLDPDLEQAIPGSTGEEELQLQLALAMSREESEKPPPTVDIDEQTQLQIAMRLSKEEAQKPVKRAPAPAPVLELDEDAQLQLALSLSKEEHQQEQLTRRVDDESDLRKALEESKREMQGKTAFMDLVDIFAVPADPPPSDIRWNSASQRTTAGATDPWDSMDNVPRADSPWMVPPSNSPPPPWEPPAYPWDSVQDSVSNPRAQDWTSASTRVDPFLVPSDKTATQGAFRNPPLQSATISDDDRFDEAMYGGNASLNGQEEDNAGFLDMSSLRDSLASARSCRTPEAFLGPTAASLVDLDALIPTNASGMPTNPFLAGASAPTAANPFQTEQPKVSLKDMNSSFASPVPQSSSLPYSASLPLPTNHQGAAIPSSLTHPTPPGLELPMKLPEPLLPFSSAKDDEAAQINVNPFL